MRCFRQHKYMAAILLGLLCAPAHAAINADKTSAVIFVYQRVGEDSVPQGNLSLDQFKAHVGELKTDGYNVLPLPQIIDALKEGAELPQKTIAITFDGAWLSTLNNALPLLQEARLPFTVFFSSDLADGGNPGHMSWKEIRTLKKSRLATLGILPSSYVHMTDLGEAENAALINKAVARYREELKEDPKFFSYPYGEYSSAVRKQIAGYSFLSAAFGQQSGVAHASSDFLALPRFTMTDAYGDLDRFMLTANALPLPVSDVVPEDMVLTQNPPMIGFTVTSDIANLSRLSCFVSGVGKTELVRPGGNRIEIRLQAPFEDRSTRVNCTMPDDTVIPGQPENWRWFGMQLIDQKFGDEAEQ